MQMTNTPWAALAALSLLPLFPCAASAQESDPLPPPEVGQIAPPLGSVQWRHLPDGKVPKLAELRGQVVVVHTWVWYCDS